MLLSLLWEAGNLQKGFAGVQILFLSEMLSYLLTKQNNLP